MAVMLLIFTATVNADSNDTAGIQTNTTSATMIEEIVITARRLEENIQDTPVTVSAFSERQLRMLQADDLADLQKTVPNLSLTLGDASNAVIYLRGIGQRDSLAFADPAIGVYVDDVYLGRAQGSFLDVVDPQRIEVLRGPQGTLYGRNTIAGAIKFISAEPTEEFTGNIEATFGNFDRIDVKATMSGPVGDDLLGRLSVAYLSRDGYSDNVFNGKDDFDKDTITWRGALLYEPREDLSIKFMFDGSINDPDTSRTPARQAGPAPIGTLFGLTLPVGDDPFDVNANFNDKEELEVFGGALVIKWDINENLSIKSITSIRSLDHETHLDLDAHPTDVFGVFVDEDQEQISQEVQLLYQGEGLKGVAGVYYFREHDTTPDGIFGPDINFVFASENDQIVNSVAVFGEASMNLGSGLNLNLGLRVTREDKDFARKFKFFAPGTPVDQVQLDSPGPLFLNLKASKIFTSTTPKIGLDYHINDDVMMYGTISKGFKSGGFDGRSQNAFQLKPFKEEEVITFEIGMKSSWLNDRLRLNATVFRNDYKDLQLSSFAVDPLTGTFSAIFTNAGEATTQGVEFELLTVLSDRLTIQANFGYLDSEYDEFIGPGGTDISDQLELINAPEWTAGGGIQYRFPVGSLGSLTLAADASYRSDFFTTVENLESLHQGDYALVNALLTFESTDGRYSISVGGKNLTDEEYFTHGFDLTAFPGVSLAYFGTPRTYSLTVGYRF